MELFDILNCMFKDPELYKEVSKSDKKKNFFMINRRLSIAHPMQASVLNILKINQEEAVDVWQRFLIKQYGGKLPGWMFIKGIKKVKEAEEKKVSISSKDIVEFSRINMFDIKSVRDAIKVYPEEMKKEIDKLQKGLNENSKS